VSRLESHLAALNRHGDREKRVAKKAAVPELRVVFDSNALFNEAAHHLVRKDVRELIEQNSNHADIRLVWHLPEVVVNERKYQMTKRGFELLPSIQKIERLLGHNLNITEGVVRERVDAAVQSAMTSLSLQRLTIAISDVDWDRLMTDAAFRKPPFDPGEKEKGFRDALVGESFLQLVAASPVSPKSCRIALVTNDELLTKMVAARTRDRTNVRLLTSLDELKELINTLASETTEEYVAGLHPAAAAVFIERDKKAGLFYSAGVLETITRQYEKELSELPAGASRRRRTTTAIAPPRFVRKEKQKIYWASRIELRSEAVAPLEYIISAPNNAFVSGLLSEARMPAQTSISFEPYGVQWPNAYKVPDSIRGWYDVSSNLGFGGKVSSTEPAAISSDTVVGKGTSVFEVVWTVVVTTKQKLNHPTVESISYVGTEWD
jgi:hypothetical protein